MVKKQKDKNGNRHDLKGRVLKPGEVQREDGRYMYTMRDPLTNKRKSVYSWKLLTHDPMPAGKRPDKSLREKEKELMQKSFVNISLDGGGLTVKQLVDRYVSTRVNVRPSTKAGYKTVQNWLAQDGFGKKRIDEVNTDMAKAWLISLQSKYKKSYSAIHSIRSVVKPAFDYAVQTDLLYKNPFKFELRDSLINDSIKREAVSHRDERRFLEFIRTDKHFSRYYDGILILFKTGLRLGELCGLTLHDVNLEERLLYVNHQLQYNSGIGKNIRQTKTVAGIRELPMTDEVYEAFVRVVENRKKIHSDERIDGYAGFLFLDERNKVMVGYQWEKRFAHIIEKYNKLYKDELPKITPHMCRHTYCTRMAGTGISVYTLSKLMGHSSIEITMDVYAHADTEQARAELKRIKPKLDELNQSADKIISMPNLA